MYIQSKLFIAHACHGQNSPVINWVVCLGQKVNINPIRG